MNLHDLFFSGPRVIARFNFDRSEFLHRSNFGRPFKKCCMFLYAVNEGIFQVDQGNNMLRFEKARFETTRFEGMESDAVGMRGARAPDHVCSRLNWKPDWKPSLGRMQLPNRLA